jgi:hypothetical protein
VKTAVKGLPKPLSGSALCSVKGKNTTQSQLTRLAAFRQSLYGCFTSARDALFELLDAVLTPPQLASFPELSCAPVFRRQWPGLYEALQDGAVDTTALLKLQVKSLPPSDCPLLFQTTAVGQPAF